MKYTPLHNAARNGYILGVKCLVNDCAYYLAVKSGRKTFLKVTLVLLYTSNGCILFVILC